MTRVLVIGASKGIGLETTRQALEVGHCVRAFARSADGIYLSSPKLQKVRGDALNSKDLDAALEGVNVVIQTLGVGLGDLFRAYPVDADTTRASVSGRGAVAAMDILERDDLAFPQSLPEFQQLFPDDAACAAYLERARWPDGFVCPHCRLIAEPFSPFIFS